MTSALIVALMALTSPMMSATNPCDRPGVIDFFPDGSGNGACFGTHPMTLYGTANSGFCEACGPATRFVYQQQPYGMLSASGVSSAISGLVFTIQLDVYGITSDGQFPAGFLAIAYYDNHVSWEYSLQVDSLGSLYWTNLNGPPLNNGSNYDQTVMSAYNVLQPGTCQTVTAVADGSFFYLYVDGALVGGPLAVDPAVERHPLSELWFGNANLDGGDVSPTYLSNILLSNSVLVPVETPERLSCDLVTPTTTPTPSGCSVGILMPPDLTAGIPHTVIATCTPVEMTATPTHNFTTATPTTLSETKSYTPTISFTAEIMTSTATPTATASTTPGSCILTNIGFDQIQNRVVGNSSASGRISVFLVDNNGIEYGASQTSPTQAGNFVLPVNYTLLPSDSKIQYTRIGVMWIGAGGNRCKEVSSLEKRFRYYGMKRITQYNTPDESRSNCQAGGLESACIQDQSCSSADASNLFLKFVQCVRIEGSGLTRSDRTISGDSRTLCNTTFIACLLKDAFKEFSLPTGMCGNAVEPGDLAYDNSSDGFSGGTFSCGEGSPINRPI